MSINDLYKHNLGSFTTVAGASSPTISDLTIPDDALYLYITFNNLTDGWASPTFTIEVPALTNPSLGKVIYSIYNDIVGDIVLTNGHIGGDLIINSSRVGAVVSVWYSVK